MQKVFEYGNSALYNQNIKDHEIYKLLHSCVTKLNLTVEPQIELFGRICTQHRAMGLVSNDVDKYEYNPLYKQDGDYRSIKHEKLDKHEELQKVLDIINSVYASGTNDKAYNSILINYYRDGNDYISAHRDKKKELGIVGVIMISIGETRVFNITHGKTKELLFSLKVNDGDLTIMSGAFQDVLKHEIVKESYITKPRISFTFRRLT